MMQEFTKKLYLFLTAFLAFPEIVKNVVSFSSGKMCTSENPKFCSPGEHQFHLALHSVNATAYKDVFLLLCSRSFARAGGHCL